MSKSYQFVARWVVASLAILVLIGMVLFVAVKGTASDELRKIDGYTPWSKETVKLAETLPVQNGGRIKPLSAQAGFSMLGLYGARSMKIIDGEGNKHTLSPTEWMLDSVFRPDLAVKLPTFRIDNSEVLSSLGIKTGSKRDRYSYSDIEVGRDKLIDLAKTYEEIKTDKRDPVQQQTIDLAYNIRNYEALLGYLGFARSGVTLAGTGNATTPDQRADISAVMSTAPQIRAEIARAQSENKEINPRIKNLLEQVIDGANFAKFGLFILPPTDAKDPTWLSAGNAIMNVMTQESKDPATAVADIKLFEAVSRSVGADDLQFRKELTRLHDTLVKRAENRGQYDRIEFEAKYYRANWFLNAMVFFLLGTLTALTMWAIGGGWGARILSWFTFGFTAIGLVLCITAIVQRCLIMQRPPVGNLYDTIIFIASTVVLLSLLIEWMTKRRFALGIAPILGAVLIVLSRRFELGDAKDHMDPLVAVLNSNYWLTIHVITITLGYSAGLLSAFIAGGYLLLRGLGLDGGDKDLRRSLTRAVYGMICLTLFLSLVGTVLGGIWANYSWGRFWGWDPKENGALMIVIWTLVVLHARLGGYIKEWGLHLAAVFTACVVVFSWWHVNFLGVGLHNYGFTSGKWTIWVFYMVIGVFMLFGFTAMFIESLAKHRTREEKARLATSEI
jgi:ABC-type transport system involved in cytochrome c biogenesis permease subunit